MAKPLYKNNPFTIIVMFNKTDR